MDERLKVLLKDTNALKNGQEQTQKEANGWTDKVKACQLAASLRGEIVDVLQTLLDTESINLNTLYNALDQGWRTNGTSASQYFGHSTE
ncbi:hypothetical protein TNCV_3449411 [Trichonephila clavipes]|nr:hypothetical protein TNCV_3449411 [Trichonephila clavipes]